MSNASYPPAPAGILNNGSARTAAVVEWQARQADGVEMTGAELAQRYDRSPSWGRQVAREARQAVAPAVPPTAPGVANETRGLASPVGDAAPRNELPHRGEEVSPWVGRVTLLAVLAVALAAAVASVEHLAVLARIAGDTGLKAWLLPASVDGLVVASTMCIYRASKLGQPAGFIPWGSLGLGLAASVVGNVVSVNPELVDVDRLTIAVGAWPPLALALSFELALRQVRETRQ